jgi:hypothetical protein
VKRGISFRTPNEQGSLIYEVMKSVDFSLYNWHIGGDEVYVIDEGEISESLFNQQILDGSDLIEIIRNNIYSVIFIELKAFAKNTTITEIASYENFMDSECEIVMLVADCNYVDIYCKDTQLIENLLINAKMHGYENIEYIDENDTRTSMYVN